MASEQKPTEVAPAEEVRTGLPNKVKWMFFCDNFAQSCGIQVTLYFMNFFCTNYLMMTPVTVALVLSVGRVVDLVISSFAGAIVQKSNLKTGPLRTFLLLNGPLLAVGNFFIFLNPNVSPAGKLACFLVGYAFRNFPQSFLIAASNSLVPKVAGNNLDDRLALTAKKSQGGAVVGIFASMVTVPFTSYLGTIIGNGRQYMVAGLLFCVVHTIMHAIAYFGLADYDKYDPNIKKVEGASQNVKFTHMYGDTFKNPAVWMLVIASVIAQISGFTLSSFNSYYFTYVLEDINLLAVVNTAVSYLGLVVVFVSPPIAKKLGKKNSYIISFMGNVIGYALIVFLGFQNFPVFLAGRLIVRLTGGPSGAVGINIWGDAAEYQLFKTGRDSRPFIMSLNSLMMKIGQFVSSFTYAAILTYTEYEALGDGKASVNVSKMHYGVQGFMLVSYVLILICYILFPVSEAKSQEYINANKKMLEERAAAAAAAAAAEGSTAASAS
jgi:Na+/melibiose symporter-like transporter